MPETTAVETRPAFQVAEVASLLNDLSQVQTELLELLQEKRDRLMSNDPLRVNELGDREQDLCNRLMACQQRRTDLLVDAECNGFPGDSIAALAGALPKGEKEQLGKSVKEAAGKMRLLQHHSLANWVLAQRALLHVAQLLEIVATGGRLQPTYGNASSSLARGGLMNGEA